MRLHPSTATGKLSRMATRPYTRRRTSAKSVERVLDAAERLIGEGQFHTATVEALAEQAGISRATVFNRFGSKLGVLEALVERCFAGPEMQAIKEALELEDPVAALEAVIEPSCAIWEARGFIVEQLNAIVVLEPGAAALIDEIEADQRSDLQGLTRRLARAERLRLGLGEARAAATLHMLTSLESFLRLRRAYGLSLRQTRETIAELAFTLLRD
jgi:AcrR family transcriptional regulator